MSTIIKFELSSDSIGQAIKELKNYKSEIESKLVNFVKILAEKGVSVAESAPMSTDNGETYNSLIRFSAESEKLNKGGAKGMVLAVEKTKVVREWLKNGKIETAEVSPLMMAEFGSGPQAQSETMESGIELGGRGTFPGQTQAFNEGWSWQDADTKEYKHSNGVIPSMPMQRAAEEMKAKIKEAAYEAFGK